MGGRLRFRVLEDACFPEWGLGCSDPSTLSGRDRGGSAWGFRKVQRQERVRYEGVTRRRPWMGARSSRPCGSCGKLGQPAMLSPQVFQVPVGRPEGFPSGTAASIRAAVMAVLLRGPSRGRPAAGRHRHSRESSESSVSPFLVGCLPTSLSRRTGFRRARSRCPRWPSGPSRCCPRRRAAAR